VFILLLLVLLLLTTSGFIPGGRVLECKTGQYNTIQYGTIQYNSIEYNNTTLKAALNKQNYKKSGTHIIHY
jgi:hypothetical protein